jgi:hypothetical protein
MAVMLADTHWIPAHLLLLTAYASLLAGLVAFARATGPAAPIRPWVLLAVLGTSLQCVEMAVHTAAVLDRTHLATGAAAPWVTAHRWLSTLLHPVFGLTLATFIVAGARLRALGAPWIAWIGVVGALGLGAANPLGFAGVTWAGRLYYLLPCLVAWLILTAIRPQPRPPSATVAA